jgi:hypothetical protein
MADDPTSIWERARKARRWQPSSPGPATSAPAAETPPPESPQPSPRITLQEASRRFGVSVPTLRSWSRSGQMDAVMSDAGHGRRWMVMPATVAARTRRPRSPASPVAGTHSSPSSTDGQSMLVPRDAWDRLMHQLGNLHLAGQQLAEARERAAKAETEAVFLRERLAEIRTERDDLRQRLGDKPPVAVVPFRETPAAIAAPLRAALRRFGLLPQARRRRPGSS